MWKGRGGVACVWGADGATLVCRCEGAVGVGSKVTARLLAALRGQRVRDAGMLAIRRALPRRQSSPMLYGSLLLVRSR